MLVLASCALWAWAVPVRAQQPDALGAPDSSPAATPDAPDEAPEQPEGEQAEYSPPSMYAVPPLPDDTSSLEGEPGAREHEGFFLRINIGPGAGRTRYKESVDGAQVSSVEASGLSGMLDVGVGGRLVGNLILHGNLLFSRFYSSTRLVDGVKDAAVHVTDSATLVGAGVSYYFMPFNVYLSSSFGLAWLFEGREDGQLRSDAGLFVTLAAGKEWWVGRSGAWGVGAALRGTFAAAPVDIAGVQSKLKSGNVAVAFSCTYN
jgi:hypothetical protein